MKKITLFIALVCIFRFTASSQSCLPEGITFTTQEQIDNFQTDYPGCTKILGSVRLEGDPVNYIANLNGLNVLTSIGGSLWIGSGMWPGGCIGLPDLGSLSGLNSITSIGGNFQLCGSPLISDLSGLENLTSIDGFLNIYDNGNLSSLSGLENLDSIGQSFYIGEVTDYGDPHGNRKLKNLSNLENLLYVGGDLYIGGNDSLSSLLGLEKVAPQSINNLQIESNPMLSNCDVQSICNYLLNPNGEVEIHDNATGCNSPEEVEEACEGSCLPEGITFTTQAQIDSFQINYPNCTNISGFLSIGGGNPYNDITNLYGLNSIVSIGGFLNIGNCSLLESLTGLDNIDTIWGGVSIGGNDDLISLNGLGNLKYIGEGLQIGGVVWGPMGELYIGNNSLLNLSGLENLNFIGGVFRLIGNFLLTSISELNNTSIIGGHIWIDHNSNLISIKGLENIDATSIDSIGIINNNVLSNCEIQSICDYLANPNSTIEIHGNAPGCNSPEEVLDSCDFSSVTYYVVVESMSVHPNPFSTSTTIEYELTKPSTVQLTIYDYLGKKVEVIEKNQSQGKQQITWNAEGLPAGVYFCVIKTNKGTNTTKLIKL